MVYRHCLMPFFVLWGTLLAMARPVRIDFPEARHHVMNRGLRRGPVFIDDWCCQEFLAPPHYCQRLWSVLKSSFMGMH